MHQRRNKIYIFHTKTLLSLSSCCFVLIRIFSPPNIATNFCRSTMSTLSLHLFTIILTYVCLCVCVCVCAQTCQCISVHAKTCACSRFSKDHGELWSKKTDRKTDVQADKTSERLPHRPIHLQTWPGVNPNWKASIVCIQGEKKGGFRTKTWAKWILKQTNSIRQPSTWRVVESWRSGPHVNTRQPVQN